MGEIDETATRNIKGTVITEQATASSHKIEIHQPASKETFNIGELPEKTLTYYEIDANATENVITVASGSTAKVYAFFYYCDADITTELRFKTSGKVIGGLSVEGAVGMNMRASDLPPYEGADDEEVEIYLSAAGNVAGWVLALVD